MMLAICLKYVVASLLIPPVEESSGVKLPPLISRRMYVVFLLVVPVYLLEVGMSVT